jgi:hypothetical protein
LHSARAPARIAARNAFMRSPFSALEKSSLAVPSPRNAAPAGPDIKKHGCTPPEAPMTAENSGALQRTSG